MTGLTVALFVDDVSSVDECVVDLTTHIINSHLFKRPIVIGRRKRINKKKITVHSFLALDGFVSILEKFIFKMLNRFIRFIEIPKVQKRFPNQGKIYTMKIGRAHV